MRKFLIGSYRLRLDSNLKEITTYEDDPDVASSPVMFTLDKNIHTEEQAIELVKKFFAATKEHEQ